MSASVRLEYELIPDDWGAFVEYCVSNSNPSRRQSRAVQLVGAGLLILAPLVMWQGRGPAWFVGAAVLAMAWWFVAPRLFRRSIRRQAMAQQRPCLSGRHVMEVVEEGVRATCDVSESLHKWAGIRQVTTTPGHVFVLIGESMGYTIPRERVVTGNVDAFLAAVQLKVTGDA